MGVLGGSFDPVHVAHLLVAERAREALELDRVLFVPARGQPLKRHAATAPADDRLALLRLAVEGNPAFEVSTLELEREEPSYTVDTLRELRARAPGAELFLILGADAYALLPRWREAGEVRRLARIVLVPRGRASCAGTEGAADDSDVLRIDVPELAVSASDIRAWVAARRTIRYLVPDAVRRHILERGLYR
ncbi:MAG: nicotinate-nucleotide adenylyltransferase [Gemmatimonadota bacterium]